MLEAQMSNLCACILPRCLANCFEHMGMADTRVCFMTVCSLTTDTHRCRMIVSLYSYSELSEQLKIV